MCRRGANAWYLNAMSPWLHASVTQKGNGQRRCHWCYHFAFRNDCLTISQEEFIGWQQTFCSCARHSMAIFWNSNKRELSFSIGIRKLAQDRVLALLHISFWAHMCCWCCAVVRLQFRFSGKIQFHSISCVCACVLNMFECVRQAEENSGKLRHTHLIDDT